MTKIIAEVSTSLDGFIAGTDDSPSQPLGVGGDTPSRYYPSFRMSAVSAKTFDEFAARIGAVIAGRRTYDVSEAWGGTGPLPGIPLFVLTHRVPEHVPDADPAYTFV